MNPSSIKIAGFTLMILAGMICMNSCIGPAGPPGQDGIDGTNGSDGADGADGADGKDGSATCIICHNADAFLLAYQEQLGYSLHRSGENYMRNATTCAGCHTHQGFSLRLASGSLEPPEPIMNPAPINCRTCHLIHMNYDEYDWRLVTTMPVDLIHTGETVDMGPSNLCVNCHQARPVDPFPEMGGDNVTITSSRWGPHHGPQSLNLWAVGGYHLAGSAEYPAKASSGHLIPGCIGCHMAPNIYTAGGHTFSMKYESSDVIYDLIQRCDECHSDISNFDYHGVQTQVSELAFQLREILINKGYLNPDTELWNASYGNPLRVSADEAGAMFNYLMIAEDRSYGVHNPNYMRALLINSIESLSLK